MGCTFLVAVSAHVAAFVLATHGSPGDRIGARGTDLDAISIEVSLVSTGALETRAQDAEKASGTAGQVDLRDGASEPQQQQQQQLAAVPDAPKPEVKREPEPPVDPVPEPAQMAAAPPPPPDAPKPEPKAKPDEAAQPEVQAGGATAIAMANVVPSPASGAAEASAGEIQAYSRGVLEVLAKARPKAAAGTGKGTVRVVFEISPAGLPTNVQIAKSSGLPRIDEIVLSAVQSVRFPLPPANATLGQRTYVLPYVFR